MIGEKSLENFWGFFFKKNIKMFAYYTMFNYICNAIQQKADLKNLKLLTFFVDRIVISEINNFI